MFIVKAKGTEAAPFGRLRPPSRLSILEIVSALEVGGTMGHQSSNAQFGSLLGQVVEQTEFGMLSVDASFAAFTVVVVSIFRFVASPSGTPTSIDGPGSP